MAEQGAFLVIRIKDWPTKYENNRTRELKNLDWVPIPNRMDGDGYTELLDHLNGCAHLGAWLAIIQIASRCEPRGTLLREGAIPHTASSLARMSRIPASILIEALPRILLIRWIELLNQQDGSISHDPFEIPHEGATECLWKGREWNRTEVLNPSPPASPDGGSPDSLFASLETPETQALSPSLGILQYERFEKEFWQVYWRKTDKQAALKAFNKHGKTNAVMDTIIAAAIAHAPYYLQRDPEHRPYAATWLNKFRYNEESPQLAEPPGRPEMSRRQVSTVRALEQFKQERGEL